MSIQLLCEQSGSNIPCISRNFFEMLSPFIRSLWATLCISRVFALPVDRFRISNDTEVGRLRDPPLLKFSLFKVRKVQSDAGMATIDAEYKTLLCSTGG